MKSSILALEILNNPKYLHSGFFYKFDLVQSLCSTKVLNLMRDRTFSTNFDWSRDREVIIKEQIDFLIEIINKDIL